MFSYCAPPASTPLPRRTARSMLSFGTELFFAFWMASYSVGLPTGSPPPVRGATSTFLISLANSLPRLAATTAFLCLVGGHGHGAPPRGQRPGPAVGEPVGQHDHPGAGPERGQPRCDQLAQRLEHVERDGQPPQRGRLTARDYQPVELMELLGAAHRHRAGADLLERAQVLGYIALQGEHPDNPCRHHPPDLTTLKHQNRCPCSRLGTVGAGRATS